MNMKNNLNLPQMKLPANLVMPHFQPWHKWAFGGLFGFFFLLWLALSILVDEDAIAKEFIAKVKSVTGYAVSYGEMDVSVLPVPTVTLYKVKLDNDPKASSQNFLIADRVEVSVDLMSLLSGNMQFNRLLLDKPQFQLEKFADKTTNWAFMEALNDKDMAMQEGVNLILQSGTLTFVDVVNNKVKSIDKFSIDLDISPKTFDVAGSFLLDNKQVRLDGEFTVSAFTGIEDFSMKGSLAAREAQNNLIYKGDMGRAAGLLTLNGTLESTFVDLKPWLFEVVSKDSQKVIGDAIPNPIPASFAANVVKAGPILNVTNLTVKGGVTAGTGGLSWTDDETDKLAMKLDFTTLDFGNIVTKSDMLFAKGAFNRLFGMFLPQGVSAEVAINAQKVHLGTVQADSLELSATLDQQELVLNQAALNLPGDNHILLFGIFKMTLDNQISFDGNIETVGKSLSGLVESLDMISQSFLTDHTGEFRGRAELNLSSTLNIISGIKFQAGDLLVAGGVTLGTSKEADAEITMEVDNIKLDGMLSYLIPTSPKDLGAVGTGFEDVKRNVSWLAEFKHRILFNVVLPRYSLGGRTGTKPAAFIVKLEPNSIDFRKADIKLDDLEVRGNLKYTQLTRIPSVEGDIYLSYLNIATAFGKKMRLSPVARGNRQEVWDTEYFNVNFLKGYDTFVKVNIGNLLHPDFGMTNVTAILNSKNDRWNIDEFQGNIWEGQVKGAFVLDVSSVPGISAQLGIGAVRADRMMDALIGQPSFRGFINVNAQIATSGLNMVSWVRNSMGHISFTGQNFAIKGFDVASLVQTVPLMRSVTDVVNTARVSLLKNQSTFSVISGFFNIEQGVMSTPEIKLRSKHATGTLKGQMDLLPWMMDMSVDFALTTLDPANYPVLRILFKDSIDDPIINFDTRSLEAFIARKKIR